MLRFYEQRYWQFLQKKSILPSFMSCEGSKELIVVSLDTNFWEQTNNTFEFIFEIFFLY